MRPLKDSPQKRKILALLRERTIVSGEFLGKELGISRTAVWKHIEELKRLGYEIEAAPVGYKLVGDPGIPYPWELEFKTVYYPVTKSTMDEAMKLVEKGAPAGLLVIAGEQRGGKGRKGSIWHSPFGGLYFSVILRPKIPMELSGRIEESALRGVREFMERMSLMPEVSRNGIFLNGRKVGGILMEAYGELDEIRFAVLGVGLNVNNPVPSGATSLSIELGRKVRLLDVAEGIFNVLLPKLSWAVVE